MFTDYQEIYTGDIFTGSQCIWHENVLLDWFRSQLIAQGYNSAGGSNKVWRRDDRTVVACLVDDITTCADNTDQIVARSWNPKTDVITDNMVTSPCLYRVHTLPHSWFGIYAHSPIKMVWRPDRRFNFSVNRLDMKRMLLFLEYRKRLPWEPDRDEMDYVNFNCWAWDGDNSSNSGLNTNFERQWQLLDDYQKTAYQETFEQDNNRLPLRNHELAHEQAMHSAWINLVVETYSGDSVIAVSEKIFRALVTPAPWMVYSGRYTVVYLESLGFDCLSDIVDHGYDAMIETRTVDYGDKIVDWFWLAQQNYSSLQSCDFKQLETRCQQAADHNLRLLYRYRQQWPQDFAAWWPKVLDHVHHACG